MKSFFLFRININRKDLKLFFIFNLLSNLGGEFIFVLEVKVYGNYLNCKELSVFINNMDVL